MTRRELIRLSGSSLLLSTLGSLRDIERMVSHSTATGGATNSRRLFFEVDDIPHIRANAATPLLRAMYQEWAAAPISAVADAMDKFESSGDIVRDFQAVVWGMSQSAMVQLVEPSRRRERALLEVIERIIARPYWDYFRDGGTEILGIQRASFATVRLLLAREILGDAISEALDAELLDAIAEKGCLPCYATVYDMDHPETARGWDFDEQHAGFYDITMERWPMILGANNLRAAPTGALGLGALALAGHDDRADEWLSAAVSSGQRFLKLISPDGSYFEGLSYLSYSLRTMLPFINAHRRLAGDVDWLGLVNIDGMIEYIQTMQMGKTPNGEADIVNFSDARTSVSPGAISLLGSYSGNTLAGYAAKDAGYPRWFFDLLWYTPDAPSSPPRAALLNKRNDLNWIISRTGWQPEDTVLAFKSGGPANHEHADRNHITLKAHGERLLNDHFGAAYDRRHAGWRMRFTEAHNAVLVDGRGHPYLDGTEGTNDSKAFANILQYEDHGDTVWWTSDASAAYILDNYHAHQVLRTVLFAKPDIVLVLDEVTLRYRPQTVDIRWYPDNADGNGRVAVDGSTFRISRPSAVLDGHVWSAVTGESSVLETTPGEARPRVSRLDVPSDVGDFPCVEVHAPAALDHQILTVLTTRSASNGQAAAAAPAVSVNREGNLWEVEVGTLRASIQATTREPKIVVW